jgi:hypothetical protein
MSKLAGSLAADLRVQSQVRLRAAPLAAGPYSAMAKIPAAGPGMALTAQLVISAGGWHPRHARVLLIEVDAGAGQGAGFGLVLVDGNGDGAELELEYWERGRAGLWRGGSSSGQGPLDGLGAIRGCSAGPFACAYGRVAPWQAVQVSYAGHTYDRVASGLGVWGFIHAPGSADPGDVPVLARAGGG